MLSETDPHKPGQIVLGSDAHTIKRPHPLSHHVWAIIRQDDRREWTNGRMAIGMDEGQVCPCPFSHVHSPFHYGPFSPFCPFPSLSLVPCPFPDLVEAFCETSFVFECSCLCGKLTSQQPGRHSNQYQDSICHNFSRMFMLPAGDFIDHAVTRRLGARFDVSSTASYTVQIQFTLAQKSK